jgi:hypothetical protein
MENFPVRLSAKQKLKNKMAGAKQGAGPHGNFVRGESNTNEMWMGSTSFAILHGLTSKSYAVYHGFACL